MNKQLPLIALALLSFVAVFLFLYLEDRDARETRDSESSPFKERTYDPLEGVVTPRRSADAAPQVTMTPDSTLESPAMGTLEIVGRLANGNRPGELEILVDPEGLDFRPTATGFEATDIAPGAYRVTLYGGDLVPVTHRALIVEAGQRTVVPFDLYRGIRPRGRLTDALDRRPIAGATIRIGDVATLTTDDDGRFACEQLVSKNALRVIDVEHPEYDRQVYRDIVITDPGAIELVLGGGTGQIVGQVTNVSGRAMPERYEVRVTIGPLRQVRRSFVVENDDRFRIDRLYCTEYRVELHFPGGEFPVQYRQVTLLQDDPVANVSFALETGVTLSGRFIAPDLVKPGLALELKSLRGELVASAEIDDEGGYTIQGLAPGRYFPIVRAGTSHHDLPELTIEPGTDLSRDIDVLRRRFIE